MPFAVRPVVVVVLVGLIATGVGVTAGRAQATGTWSQVSTLTSNSDLSQYPKIGLDASGRAVAAWSEDLNGGSLPVAEGARQTRPGGSWSQETALSPTDTGSLVEGIVVDGAGDAGALWNQGFETGSTSPAPLPRWGTAVSIAPRTDWRGVVGLSSASGALDGVLAGDARGDLDALVLDADGSRGRELDVSRLKRGATRWPMAVRLAGGSGLQQPALAESPDGAAVAVWEVPSGGSIFMGQRLDVFAARRSRSQRWSPPRRIGRAYYLPLEDSGTTNPPQAEVAVGADGDGTVVWQCCSTSSLRVFADTWRGGRWSGAVAVSTQPGINPEVGIDGSGRATVVWMTPDKGVDTASQQATGRWNATERLGGGQKLVSFPQIAENSAGAAIVSWNGVHTRIRPSAQAQWSPNKRLPRGGVTQVAINARGDAAVIWGQSAGSSHAVVITASYQRSG